MTITEILLIGTALSMDAFSVCLSAGMIYSDLTRKKQLLLPAVFGLFQGLMPMAGYFAGYTFKSVIEKWQGTISLAVLGIIGVNMIREGIMSIKNGGEEPADKKLTAAAAIALAVATSIDAFAVGVSFAASGVSVGFSILTQNIFVVSAIIAVITFILCIAAAIAGRKTAGLLGQKAEILGGTVLIIIGIKNMFF